MYDNIHLSPKSLLILFEKFEITNPLSILEDYTPSEFSIIGVFPNPFNTLGISSDDT